MNERDKLYKTLRIVLIAVASFFASLFVLSILVFVFSVFL